MQLTIRITGDNAAFEDDPIGEIERVLKQLVFRLASPRTFEPTIGPSTNRPKAVLAHVDTQRNVQTFLSLGELVPVHVVDPCSPVCSLTHGG